tara:strand:- start:1269 stop:1439 length:171 start_codon:yes stop_codon:yes gene_type:complete
MWGLIVSELMKLNSPRNLNFKSEYLRGRLLGLDHCTWWIEEYPKEEFGVACGQAVD